MFVKLVNEHSPHPVGPLSLEATVAPVLVSSVRPVLPVHVDPGMTHVPALNTVKAGTVMMQSTYFCPIARENGAQVVVPGGCGAGGGGRGGGKGGGALAKMA